MSRKTHSGEAIIRKAFYRSLLTLVVILIAAYAIYLFSRQEPEQVVVSETEIKGPVITQQPAIIAPQVEFTDITHDAGIVFVHKCHLLAR